MTPVGVTTVRELRPGNKINVGEAIATVSKALAVFRPADSSMSPQGAVKRSLTLNSAGGSGALLNSTGRTAA